MEALKKAIEEGARCENWKWANNERERLIVEQNVTRPYGEIYAPRSQSLALIKTLHCTYATFRPAVGYYRPY